MYAAGRRQTHPPDRLIDRLLESGRPKMSPTTTSTTTSVTTLPTNTTPMLSTPNLMTSSTSDSTNKSEVSLSDILGFMKLAKEESCLRFDQLEKCVTGFGPRQDAVEARATKIEKNVSTLHRAYQDQATAVSRIDQDVSALKDAVQKLQTSNSVTTPVVANLLNQTFVAPDTHDMSRQ